MNPAKIILVDDEESFRVSTAELLRRNGFACDDFDDIRSAKDALAENQYKVLISDLRMSGNLKMEFIDDVKARNKDLSVIVSTGFPSVESAVKSIDIGVSAYLVKPYSINDLIASLSKLETNAFGSNQNSLPEPRKKVLSTKLPGNISADLLEDFSRGLDKLAILAVTDVSGRIIFANDLFCKISKYSLDELLGQDHRILNSGVHPKSFFHDMWKSVLGGQTWRAEVCNRAKDGILYWVDTYVYGVFDATGKLQRIVSFRIDITSRKQSEAAVKEVTEGRVYTNQSNAFCQLAAGASHELNNPLAILLGNLSLVEKVLQKSEITPESVDLLKRYTTKISNASIRIREALKLLQEMSEADDVKLESTMEPSVMISRALLFTREHAHAAGIVINVETRDNQPFEGFPKLIIKAIVNIVSFFSETVDQSHHGSKALLVRGNSIGKKLEFEITGAFTTLNQANLSDLDEPFFYIKSSPVRISSNVFIARNACRAAGANLAISNMGGTLKFTITAGG